MDSEGKESQDRPARDIAMSLDFIRDVLLAADEASDARAQMAFLAKAMAGEDYFAEMKAYREGYKAALVTVALISGIQLAIVGEIFPDAERVSEEQGITQIKCPLDTSPKTC